MSVLQNRPARSVLAAAMLTALIASMLMFMPTAEAQSPSTTVTATPSSDATITVQWTSVSGVTNYDVQFIQGSGTGHDLNDVTARDVSSGYVSRSLLPDTEYSVRVFDASNNAELGRTDVTTSARLAPGSVPRTRSIDISENEFAVVWMPAPRATSYKVEHRRHDGQFDSTYEYNVTASDSLEYYAYVGSGNASTIYHVRITPRRDYADDGPSYVHTVRTMASGKSNPWGVVTFENTPLPKLSSCSDKDNFPPGRSEIYGNQRSLLRYIDECVIDIGNRTTGALRSDSHFGGPVFLDVHDAKSDIRRDAWFDGKSVEFQHPLTVMAVNMGHITRVYAVSRGMQASIGGQSVNLLLCIRRSNSTDTKRSECTFDIAGTSTRLVITPAGTGVINVAVNGTDVGGDVSGSLASGLGLTLPQNSDGDLITIKMPSVTVGQKDYVFQIRVTPPPPANAPTQVTGLTETGSTDESITVSWNTIADVDRYVVEHSTDSSFATHTDINLNKQGSNPPATSVTIDGLTEDTTYYVRVYAVNSDGDGLRSLPLTVSTTEADVPPVAPPAPSAPTDLDINAPGQANDLHDPDRKTDAKRLARRATLKKLKADWEEVTIPSGAVTYKVEWRASGESYTDENSHTTIALEYEITGLKRNTQYTVRVSAIATDNGLSTPGPATSETGRTRRAAYDCANVQGSIAISGTVPAKIDLVAGQETTITMPSYTGPVCHLDIYVVGRVLRRADFTNDPAPVNNELGPRHNGARDMLDTTSGIMKAASYDVGDRALTLEPKATSVSLGYQDMLMSVAWSAMGWTGHKAHAAEVRVHNLPQLTIGSSSGDFRVSKQNSVVSIRGGLDRSYRLYNAAYNSGGYEIEACNVSNGDCGNDSWTRIHKSARAAGADGRIDIDYTLPVSSNQYRFRVREYLDLRHNDEVAYSEWSSPKQVN